MKTISISKWLPLILTITVLTACTGSGPAGTPAPGLTSSPMATFTAVAGATFTPTPFPTAGEIEKSLGDTRGTLTWAMNEKNVCAITVKFTKGSTTMTGEYVNQENPGKPCNKEDIASLLRRFQGLGGSSFETWEVELMNEFFNELR